MKKQILSRVIFSLLAIAIISSCKKKDDPSPSPQDAITIVSVTPSTGLVDGQSTSFDVEVKYTLNTANQGEISVGFNTNNASYYSMDVSATFAVTKGTGTHTFTTTAVAKNWGSSNHFKAYVNIAKTPHDPVYSPSASDTENLSF